MTERDSLAARIRERYPDGLTAILAMGGTRVTYILEYNRQSQDPGQLDMRRYGDDMNARTRRLLQTYFELGGQNVIIPLLSYQLFEQERGDEYAALTAGMSYDLLGGEWVQFYYDNHVDPYFAGIDTLLRFPERELAYRLGSDCARFNAQWQYQAGRRKLIWEVAPIPLYSIWRAHDVLGDEARDSLEATLDAATNLQEVHDTLYRYYARAAYGTDVPMPHFYLGNNRNGDLKLRALLPIALSCGGPMRMFFTPYPTMFITRETLETLLEDLLSGKRLRSTATDYSGKFTQELAEMEYNRVVELSADPTSTLGLVRVVETPSRPS